MNRSFTIEAIYRNGNRIKIDGGRYLSSTPSSAARKAFSQAYRHLNTKGRLSLVVHIKETTRNSSGKVFKYRVSKVAEKNEVERNGEIIVYHYTTKVKAL
jgi:hypothetical protein